MIHLHVCDMTCLSCEGLEVSNAAIREMEIAIDSEVSSVGKGYRVELIPSPKRPQRCFWALSQVESEG